MKLQFQNKNAIIYDRLRKSIINGDYKPGSRLVIDQLAVELGVSPIPIREAIRQLEADGFVKTEPYTAATVTEINANLIFEIFGLLESTEVLCSRTACMIMTDQELANVTALVEKMDTTMNQPAIWSEQNKELHLLVSEYSRLSLVKMVMHNVFDHWDRLRTIYLKDVFGHRIQPAQVEHHDILQAFLSRQPEQVVQLVREHNQNSLNSYITYLRSVGELEQVGGTL